MNQAQLKELEALNHRIASKQKENTHRIIEIELLKEALALAKAGIVDEIEKERMTSHIKVFTHEAIRDATTTLRLAEAEKQTIEKIRDLKRERLLTDIEIQTLLRSFTALTAFYGSTSLPPILDEPDEN